MINQIINKKIDIKDNLLGCIGLKELPDWIHFNEKDFIITKKNYSIQFLIYSDSEDDSSFNYIRKMNITIKNNNVCIYQEGKDYKTKLTITPKNNDLEIQRGQNIEHINKTTKELEKRLENLNLVLSRM